MSDIKLLGISGSLRTGSMNTKLLHEAARVLAPASFGLGDLNLPLYDGDLEDAQGVPEAVQTLADQISAADAVLISTPEYNQSLSGVLKNALDWVSRVEGNPWAEKPVMLMAGAAGRSGGARGAYALRLAMASFRPWLVPGPEVLIAGGAGAFDDNGHLTDARAVKTLDQAMAAMASAVARLKT